MTCKVAEYRAPAGRKVRGTNVDRGQTLFAIQHIPSKLYFIWSYSDRDYAERIAQRVAPDGDADIAANWRKSLIQLTPTDRKADR